MLITYCDMGKLFTPCPRNDVDPSTSRLTPHASCLTPHASRLDDQLAVGSKQLAVTVRQCIMYDMRQAMFRINRL